MTHQLEAIDAQIRLLHERRDAADRRVSDAEQGVKVARDERSRLEARIKELAEAKLEARRNTTDTLADAHTAAQWMDKDGDLWAYHEGAWWCREDPTDFGPYTRVIPDTIDALGNEHRDHAWIDNDGDRWDYRDGKWQCSADLLVVNMTPFSTHGPYKRVVE